MKTTHVNDGRIGTFRPERTRDGEAWARDGQPFYDVNRVDGHLPDLLEILFADGSWMLAFPEDLVWVQ